MVDGASDDPPLIFAWNSSNIANFIVKLSIYIGNFDSPFVLPGLINIESFEQAIMDYLRNLAGTPSRIEQICLPGTLRNYSQLMSCVASLNHDPWWNAVDNMSAPSSFPLARLYHPKPRSAIGMLDPALLIQNQNAPFQ
jgi:hypothetical protein